MLWWTWWTGGWYWRDKSEMIRALWVFLHYVVRPDYISIHACLLDAFLEILTWRGMFQGYCLSGFGSSEIPSAFLYQGWARSVGWVNTFTLVYPQTQTLAVRLARRVIQTVLLVILWRSTAHLLVAWMSWLSCPPCTSGHTDCYCGDPVLIPVLQGQTRDITIFPCDQDLSSVI